MLLVNAPNNPTGWTLSRAEQQVILDHCRRTGTWIVADEVYERVWFGDGAAAPSFLDIAEPDDRLVVAHSFSKSFLMTGWRLGWLVVPPRLIDAIGKLIEFNTSCAPVFVQRARAGRAGAGGRLRAGPRRAPPGCRDTLLPRLAALPGVSVASPPGGMYAFFRVEGQDDSLAFAKRLVVEPASGSRPASAFGAAARAGCAGASHRAIRSGWSGGLIACAEALQL